MYTLLQHEGLNDQINDRGITKKYYFFGDYKLGDFLQIVRNQTPLAIQVDRVLVRTGYGSVRPLAASYQQADGSWSSIAYEIDINYQFDSFRKKTSPGWGPSDANTGIDDDLTVRIEVSTGVDTIQLNESLDTIRYDSTIPAYQNTINSYFADHSEKIIGYLKTTPSQPKGVEIESPYTIWSETWSIRSDKIFPAARLTSKDVVNDYLTRIKDLKFCRNSKPFRGFDEKSVLITDASASYSQNDRCELTYQFHVKEPVTITRPGFPPIKASGHDLIEPVFDQLYDTTGKKQDLVMISVLVHEVRETKDFTLLGIG